MSSLKESNQKILFQDICVDNVIATTMSVDISEIIRLCSQICFPNIDKLNEKHIKYSLNYLKDRMWVFYDRRHIHNLVDEKVGNISTKNCVMADQFVYPINCDSPCFHPKIILVRYHLPNQEEPKKYGYRLQVSSKNLTGSRSYEVACVLDGMVDDNQSTINHNLFDFVKYLEKNGGIEEGTFNQISEELNKVKFSLLDKSYNQDVEIKVVVSGKNITTQETLLSKLCPFEEKSGDKKSENWFVLSPDYETSQNAIENLPIYRPKGIPTHAKLYFHSIDENNSEFWIGSANASSAGLCENVECMVHIKGDFEKPQEDDDGVKFWGREFERVEESKMEKKKVSWELHNSLITFINEHKISLIEKKSKLGKNEWRRSCDVHIDSSNDNSNSDTTIFFLPLGMNEVTQNGDSKWQEWKEKKKYSFSGSNINKDPCVGYLRIRICDKNNNNEETTICIQPQIGKQLLENNENEVLMDFFERRWFQEILVNSHFNAERIKSEIDVIKQMYKNREEEINSLTNIINHYIEIREKMDGEKNE